ncbi:hypothetical protein Tco_1538757 [Tanacetum coccineum]|uniref:Uncharacterized protein n=1 Tax=Tanacetum coccineum TaxID=301880 RepID=A0ABQ5BBR6_9ASTR
MSSTPLFKDARVKVRDTEEDIKWVPTPMKTGIHSVRDLISMYSRGSVDTERAGHRQRGLYEHIREIREVAEFEEQREEQCRESRCAFRECGYGDSRIGYICEEVYLRDGVNIVQAVSFCTCDRSTYDDTLSPQGSNLRSNQLVPLEETRCRDHRGYSGLSGHGRSSGWIYAVGLVINSPRLGTCCEIYTSTPDVERVFSTGYEILSVSRDVYQYFISVGIKFAYTNMRLLHMTESPSEDIWCVFAVDEIKKARSSAQLGIEEHKASGVETTQALRL